LKTLEGQHFMSSETVFSSGDTQLDADHRNIQNAIDVLCSAGDSARISALDELRKVVASHFETEDIDLQRMGDGNAKCHIDEHAAVLVSLDDVRIALVSRERDEEFKSNLVSRLGTQLLQWLPMHVREMDTSLVKYRIAQRFGGAPVNLVRR
jgi:hemerythrin